MERLSRFALYLGIGIGVTFFVLFLIAALPSIIENSWDQWERLDRNDKSQDELYQKMIVHPAYVAMYEEYPDAKEEFVYHGRGNGNIRVGVMNFENNNQLILNLYYNTHNDNVDAGVHCNTQYDRHGQSADGLFAEDFIRNTDCLTLEAPSDVVDTQGDVIATPRIVTLD